MTYTMKGCWSQSGMANSISSCMSVSIRGVPKIV